MQCIQTDSGYQYLSADTSIFSNITPIKSPKFKYAIMISSLDAIINAGTDVVFPSFWYSEDSTYINALGILIDRVGLRRGKHFILLAKQTMHRYELLCLHPCKSFNFVRLDLQITTTKKKKKKSNHLKLRKKKEIKILQQSAILWCIMTHAISSIDRVTW